jgi:hypothetical protein
MRADQQRGGDSEWILEAMTPRRVSAVRGIWTPWSGSADLGPMSGTSARAFVYCFGHAGGAAGSYLNWARRTTAQDVEICPVELPGYGTRMGEAQLTDVDDLLDLLVEALFDHRSGPAPAWPTGPGMPETRPRPGTSSLAALLPQRQRVCGPDHPATLDARARLTFWTVEATARAGTRLLPPGRRSAVGHIWRFAMGWCGG